MAVVSPEDQLVRGIHAAAGRIVVAVTGGGSGAISALLRVPGGSRTVLEAIVPYSAAALAEFLGAAPEQFCSPRTARAMAMAAFERARRLQSTAHLAPGENTGDTAASVPIGISCTASLASDRPKRGPHRIHVAFQTSALTTTHSVELIKGRRSRADEEDLSAQLVLNAIAEAVGMEERLSPKLLDDEAVQSTCTVAPGQWQDLLLERTDTVPNEHAADLAGHAAVFPGAFNPLHAGHLQMAEVAARRLGTPVEFEISIENVDKPPLDYTQMELRAAPFHKKSLPLWFTRAPTFEEKSRLFPGATFIVGADTLVRIGQPRYYGDDAATAEAAIRQIAERGCRFLVFGRLVEGRFETLTDLDLPDSLRKLCDEIRAAEFRDDISSTKLRQADSEA